MKSLYAAFALVAAMTLSGCGSLGIVTPQTYGESLIYGYETNAFVRKGAADALNDKKITKSDAQRVLSITNSSREGLDEARQAGCPNMKADDRSAPACMSNLPETTIGKLKFAVGLANQALKFLQSHGILTDKVVKEL